MCISFDLTYNPVLSTYSLPRLASPVPSVSDGTVLVWTPCWVPMEWTHRLTAYPVRTPYQGEKVLVRQCLVVSASFHKILINCVTYDFLLYATVCIKYIPCSKHHRICFTNYQPTLWPMNSHYTQYYANISHIRSHHRIRFPNQLLTL